jgi:hypothetical protein
MILQIELSIQFIGECIEEMTNLHDAYSRSVRAGAMRYHTVP